MHYLVGNLRHSAAASLEWDCAFPTNAALGKLLLGKRGLSSGPFNHWAALIEVPTHGYMNVEYTTNGIRVRCRGSLELAARSMCCARDSDVATSTYGTAPGTVQSIRDIATALETKFTAALYAAATNDCQNFARAFIDKVNNKWVGVFPIEDGVKIKADGTESVPASGILSSTSSH